MRVFCLFLCLALPSSEAALAAAPPNVLFIVVDDLNDWVGCLGGNAQAKTPNIDRLAARGCLFQNAYCAVPICNGSRTAVLTGQRPSSTGVYGNGNDWHAAVAEQQLTTLNAHFKNHGYAALGAGKIYHEGFQNDTAWDEFYVEGRGVPSPAERSKAGRISFGPIDAPESEMGDAKSVAYCVDQLGRPRDKPLFLACGLHKPHLSWFVPRAYFDLFPLSSIELPRVLDTDLDDVGDLARVFADPAGDARAVAKSGRAKNAVQGYLAACAFADAMVGRLLDALDRSPIAENTVVVLWGDHGFHLGEKLHWSKNTLWEESARAPLIFVVPGLTTPGSQSRRTVDFMSIYPTLCDVCGLPNPGQSLDGVSLRPLLERPDAEWNRPALTTRGSGNHTVRTEGWRYIRYADGAEELYDETADPHEWTNLADRPEFASRKAELAKYVPQHDAPTSGKVPRSEASKARKKKLERQRRAEQNKAAAPAATPGGC